MARVVRERGTPDLLRLVAVAAFPEHFSEVGGDFRIGPRRVRVLQVLEQPDVVIGRAVDSDGAERRLLGSMQIGPCPEAAAFPEIAKAERAVEAAATTLAGAGLKIKEECPPGVTHGSRLWAELFSYVAFQQLVQFYHGRRREAGALRAERHPVEGARPTQPRTAKLGQQ